MFDKGRHDSRTKDYQESRYTLRRGMARAALRHKRERTMVDAYGHPLRAVEMAERHGTKTLQRWADGRSISVVVGTGMDFCPQCHRVPEACDC